MNTKQKNMWSMIGTVVFTILAALWMGCRIPFPMRGSRRGREFLPMRVHRRSSASDGRGTGVS